MTRMMMTCSVLLVAFLPACATDVASGGDPAESDLPGDIDDAPEDTSGKDDAWDFTNDPARLAQRLNYRLADLPRNGKLDKPVWAARFPQSVGQVPVAWSDTYWPSAELSSNVRWAGAGVKSPLEKYDAAFNSAAGCPAQPDTTCGPTAKSKWDEYRACAGPAAKWHISNFQTIAQMFDGVNNDGRGGADDCSASDDEGPQGWWGLCHAWAPASLLEPEPQHPVTINGQTFEVADIKALIQTVYDRTEALMLGGRCNGERVEHDGVSSANEECQDVNAGALHVILGNFLGLNDMAVIEDRTASGQVWNQPIVGYNATKLEKVSASRANDCVGATGSTWSYNTSAAELYEVEMTIEFLVEGQASARPLGMDHYISRDSVHYILELGRTGKVIGGRYCSDSVNDHPDFLWAPVKVSSSSYGRNPNVSLEKVQELIGLSIAGGSSKADEEKSYAAAGGAEIPDNSPAGGSVAIDVPDAFTFSGVSVQVDIQHTWRGDLKVELLKDGRSVTTLHDRVGGSADDITQVYALEPTAVGGDSAKGVWTLRAVDVSAQDVGRIRSFKLVFAH
jgi:hypothetical protein